MVDGANGNNHQANNGLLSKPDAVKVFLASLLVSLLRPQQLAAGKLAKQRQEMKG